jgi:hypothetical protein
MKDNKVKIESYIWKNKKDMYNSEQSSIRMIDMNEITLKEKYEHCKTMLMNTSREHPGRYVVLKEISQQINDCGAELLIRWFESLDCNPKYTRFTLLTEIRNALQNNKDTFADQEVKIQNIYSGLPPQLNGITISSIIKGCKDTLGKFNRKHITKTFIIKQGIWFTAQEAKEFTEISQAKTMSEKLTVVKERLGINSVLELPVNATGLNYAQFRGMILLGVSKKYSELTTLQLETLRYKVLFALEEEVFFHINKWETLMAQIEEVSEFKGFKL